MNKRIIAIASLLLVGAALFACDMSFFLISSDGKGVRVTPDSEIQVKTGEDYILRVIFREDHGRCEVPADETVFLLDDEKWKVGKSDAALKLQEGIVWKDLSSKSHQAEIQFEVKGNGEIDLEVIRDCDRKGGYDEVLSFYAS